MYNSSAKNRYTGESVAIKKVSWDLGQCGSLALTVRMLAHIGHQDFQQTYSHQKSPSRTEVSSQCVALCDAPLTTFVRLLHHFRGHKNVRSVLF